MNASHATRIAFPAATAGAGVRCLAAASWVLLLALVACTTTTRSTSVPVAAPDPSKDRITASDEPDADRRARVRLELAGAYFGRGQMTTALDEVKLAIAANPNLAAAFNLRGLVYASLGEHPLAEESFRRALQLDPRDADSMQNYGWYLCQLQRYAEAQQLFAKALAIPQYLDAPRTLLTQGICFARQNQLPAAEASLRRAFELEPANPSIAVNLADVLYRRGGYERARSLMRPLNANPDISNAQTLWLATRIERRLGNAQGTQALGKQLRDRFPHSPETAALDQGQFDE